MIAAVKARTDRPFLVNVFCHRPATADAAREAAWLDRLRLEFARYGATPPDRLTEIYQTFLTDDAKLAVLLCRAAGRRQLPFWLARPRSDRSPSQTPESYCLRRRRISTRGGRSPRRASTPSWPKATKRADIAACSTRLRGRSAGHVRLDPPAGEQAGHPGDRRRRDHGRGGNRRRARRSARLPRNSALLSSRALNRRPTPAIGLRSSALPRNTP